MARFGRADSLALATIGALPRWNAKSGRSTCGRIRISANRNSSKISRNQRQFLVEFAKTKQR